MMIGRWLVLTLILILLSAFAMHAARANEVDSHAAALALVEEFMDTLLRAASDRQHAQNLKNFVPATFLEASRISRRKLKKLRVNTVPELRAYTVIAAGGPYVDVRATNVACLHSSCPVMRFKVATDGGKLVLLPGTPVFQKEWVNLWWQYAQVAQYTPLTPQQVAEPVREIARNAAGNWPWEADKAMFASGPAPDVIKAAEQEKPGKKSWPPDYTTLEIMDIIAPGAGQKQMFVEEDERRVRLLTAYEPGKASFASICRDWEVATNAHWGIAGISKDAAKLTVHMMRDIHAELWEHDFGVRSMATKSRAGMFAAAGGGSCEAYATLENDVRYQIEPDVTCELHFDGPMLSRNDCADARVLPMAESMQEMHAAARLHEDDAMTRLLLEYIAPTPALRRDFESEDARRTELLKSYRRGEASYQQICADWRYAEDAHVGILGIARSNDRMTVTMGRNVEAVEQHMEFGVTPFAPGTLIRAAKGECAELPVVQENWRFETDSRVQCNLVFEGGVMSKNYCSNTAVLPMHLLQR